MRTAVALLAFAAALHGQRYRAARTGDLIQLTDRDSMRAVISPAHGAELCGLEVKIRGAWRELLYRACDYTPAPGWTGRAPWLWPATGRNFPKGVAPNEAAGNSSYDFQGKRYPMPIHGFARDMAWRVESAAATGSGARAVLSLADTPRTNEMYPFGWRLEVEYVVAGGELSAGFRVRASEQNSREMFFSAGNHITFRLPFVDGSSRTGTTLQSPSEIEYVKNGFMPTGEKRKRSLAVPTPLGELPVREAVTLGGYRQGIWMTLADPAGFSVTLQHAPSAIPAEACLFNMWGDAAAGYFSPEPWVGMQNSLVSGDGLIRLKPGAEWSWRLRLTTLDTGGKRPREIPAL